MDVVIQNLLCLLGLHAHRYLERRARAGVQVPHYICEVCGSAVPVLQRTEAEYREIAFAQLQPLKARKVQTVSASERARVLSQFRPVARTK